MKVVYKPLEPFGFEQIIIEYSKKVPLSCTDIEPPVPNWKPKFDFEKNKWIETATEEEAKGSAVDDVTELEKLKKENEELRQRVDMSDEALLELADVVLSATAAMKGGE